MRGSAFSIRDCGTPVQLPRRPPHPDPSPPTGARGMMVEQTKNKMERFAYPGKRLQRRGAPVASIALSPPRTASLCSAVRPSLKRRVKCERVAPLSSPRIPTPHLHMQRTKGPGLLAQAQTLARPTMPEAYRYCSEIAPKSAPKKRPHLRQNFAEFLEIGSLFLRVRGEGGSSTQTVPRRDGTRAATGTRQNVSQRGGCALIYPAGRF